MSYVKRVWSMYVQYLDVLCYSISSFYQNRASVFCFLAQNFFLENKAFRGFSCSTFSCESDIRKWCYVLIRGHYFSIFVSSLSRQKLNYLVIFLLLYRFGESLALVAACNLIYQGIGYCFI